MRGELWVIVGEVGVAAVVILVFWLRHRASKRREDEIEPISISPPPHNEFDALEVGRRFLCPELVYKIAWPVLCQYSYPTGKILEFRAAELLSDFASLRAPGDSAGKWVPRSWFDDRRLVFLEETGEQ